jgi:hypothetical protein
MKWKDVLVGAFVTLVVTVIGGVAIYYLTREPQKLAPAEQLMFEVDPPVAFESELTRLSVVNIRVKNGGDEAAKNVAITVRPTDKAKVLDRKVSLSSGPVGEFNVQAISESAVDVAIPVLTPGETVSITILLDRPARKLPTVAAKSDRSVAQPTPRVDGRATAPSNAKEMLAKVVPAALVAQIFLLLLLFPVIRRFLHRVIPNFRNANNTAFVLLHRGLADDAHAMLHEQISREGGEPLSLANYALSVGLRGDMEKAERLMDAAEFWADTNRHERAVVAFSRAILRFRERKEADGLAMMRQALEFSKSTIIRYSRYSTLLSDARCGSPDLHSLLNEFRVERTGA